MLSVNLYSTQSWAFYIQSFPMTLTYVWIRLLISIPNTFPTGFFHWCVLSYDVLMKASTQRIIIKDVKPLT